MTNWEFVVGAAIVVLACAVDWVLWRHYHHIRDRDLDRLVKETARKRR